MKTIAIVTALLFLSACASSDGFEKNPVSVCSPGDPIAIEAGFQDPGTSIGTGGRMTLLVNVANNSDAEITVASVRADPQSVSQQSAFQFDGGVREVNREIAEGDDATFEIPVTVRVVNRDMQTEMMRHNQTVTAQLEVAVTVKLANGDASRCRFRVPAPVQF
jgi:hypothetical protein